MVYLNRKAVTHLNTLQTKSQWRFGTPDKLLNARC